MAGIFKINNNEVFGSDGTFSGTIGSNATFPANHIVQVVTDSKSHSGNGISFTGSGQDITESEGYQIFNTAFTPKYSNSKIIIQTSNVLVAEQSNLGDFGWLGAWYDTTNVAFVFGSPHYSHFSGNLNLAILSLNHVFNSWGTTSKNINIRGGMNSAGVILNQSGYSPTSPSTQTVGLTIMEVKQ
jgi:hypothetical protein